MKPSDLARALAALRKTHGGGRPAVLEKCKGCKAMLTARERRKPCPHCGARNR